MLMRASLNKNRLLGCIAVALALVCATVAFAAGGSADTPAVKEERFTTYREPTGPELTPQEAMEKAVQRVLMLEQSASPLAEALSSRAVAVDVTHSNLASVRAVEQGRQPSEAITTGSDIEQTELLRSAVYLVRMTGQFRPDVPRPRDATAPHGSVILVTLDAHTGVMIGLQLGGTPDIPALGPVVRFSIGTGSDSGSATVAEPLDQRRGLLLGTVFHYGKPARGWRIVVASGQEHSSATTTGEGGFVFHLLPGTYAVRAFSPKGTPCAKRTEQIFRRHNSYVALQCK